MSLQIGWNATSSGGRQAWRALCLLALLLGTGSLMPARATYLPARFAPDARARGMGEAFTAVAEGPWAVVWNPGALGLRGPVTGGLALASEEGGETIALGLGGRWQQVGLGLAMRYHAYEQERSDDLSGSAWRDRLRGGLVHAGIAMGVGEEQDAVHLGFGGSLKVATERFRRTAWSDTAPDDGDPYRLNEWFWDVDLGAIVRIVLPLTSTRASNEAPPHVELRLGGLAGNALANSVSFDVSGGFGGVEGGLSAKNRFARAGVGVAVVPMRPRAGRVPARLLLSTDWQELLEEEDDEADPVPSGINYFGAELTVMDLISLRVGAIDEHARHDAQTSFGCGLALPVPGLSRCELHYASYRETDPALFWRTDRLHQLTVDLAF